MANKLIVMKKIFVFLFISGLCVSLNAQKARIVDLSLRILEPTPMTPINSPSTVNFKLSITNKGTDEMHLGDSFDMFFTFVNPPYFSKRLPLNQTVKAGDSLIMDIPILIDHFESNYYYAVTISVYLFNYATPDSVRSETLSMQADNRRTVRLPLTKTSGVVTKTNQNLSMFYPNPTADYLYFTSDFSLKGHKYFATVYNTSGQQVLAKIGLVDSGPTLDLKTLKNGMYFVNFDGGNLNYRQKIQVQK